MNSCPAVWTVVGAFAGFGLIFNPSAARAALLAWEPFTNAPGTAIIGSSDGTGFSGAWQSNSSGVPTNTVGLIPQGNAGNLKHGIDQNKNTAGLMVDQNSSWANGSKNFYLDHGANTTPHFVRNNLSFDGGSADTPASGMLATNNSWQVISPAPTANDFQSVNVAYALAPRQADGSLPDNPFLRPVSGGRLVDQGVDLGEPYSAAAPDLGAFEDVP